MRPALALLLAAAVAGCGAEPTRMSFACTEDRAALERALERAPEPVVLADGTRLSACVGQADDDAELQSFGVLVTAVADRLAERAASDPRAAARLGYLVGAARRGGSSSNGVQAELVHRLEAVARRVPESAGEPFARGLAAGERTG